MYVVAPAKCPTRHRSGRLHLIGCQIGVPKKGVFLCDFGAGKDLRRRVVKSVIAFQTEQRLLEKWGLGGGAITAVKETIAESV